MIIGDSSITDRPHPPPPPHYPNPLKSPSTTPKLQAVSVDSIFTVVGVTLARVLVEFSIRKLALAIPGY